MKISTLALLISALFIFNGCDKDNEQNEMNFDIDGTWNLVQVTGGFAGINCNYEEGEIVWTFDTANLTIKNNISNPEPICAGTGLGDMTAPYGILHQNDKMYLLLDGTEIGEISIGENQFELDQNSSSQGQGADGFGLLFKQ